MTYWESFHRQQTLSWLEILNLNAAEHKHFLLMRRKGERIWTKTTKSSDCNQHPKAQIGTKCCCWQLWEVGEKEDAMQRDKILRSSFFVFSTSLVISLTNVSILMQQMVTIFLPSSKVQMIYLVGVYFAYLPILVMIISVPISWNRFHKSSFSRETLMLGSGLVLAVPLALGGVAVAAEGPMVCIMESNPRWGPNGNPRKLSHFRKWANF